MTYGTCCVISIVFLIISFTAAILIGKRYEIPDFKTKNACEINTTTVVPKVGDSCKVWDDNTEKCLKGSIVKKMVNDKEQLVCEKKPIMLAIICLVIAGLSLIAAIFCGYKYHTNKSA
jgi:hypothetical protein